MMDAAFGFFVVPVHAANAEVETKLNFAEERKELHSYD